MITWEVAKAICKISHETRRQVGLILNRRGKVVYVLVGNDREIVIPNLSEYRLGRQRLRGVRCLHTHLKDSPLTQDDLTDLALLRLDLMAAIGIQASGLPGHFYQAHLLPPTPQGLGWEVLSPCWTHDLCLDFKQFIATLENELAQKHGALDVREQRERAMLISISTGSRAEQEDSLEELKDLARSADVITLDTFVQRPKHLHPKYMMGEGKLKELIIKAHQEGATLLIFDQNLSPTRVKAITDVTDLKVIDRTQLILDIFARRAHSRDGKIQVELAQLKYRLPRLSERSTALSRLTGGIGGRGPGETKLEEDRRRTQNRILHLEEDLDRLARAHRERRARRLQSRIPIVSIVGYTNAGKSTLLNALTESKVLTDNLLFATLDTTTRRLRFPQEREVIITDTVGFLRELPEDLIGAFRPTLDELQDAHMILHVIDVSNPHFAEQMAAVDKTLLHLGLECKPRLLVFNKEDRLISITVKDLCRRYDAISVSAIHPETLPKLVDVLEKYLFSPVSPLLSHKNGPSGMDHPAQLPGIPRKEAFLA